MNRQSRRRQSSTILAKSVSRASPVAVGPFFSATESAATCRPSSCRPAFQRGDVGLVHGDLGDLDGRRSRGRRSAPAPGYMPVGATLSLHHHQLDADAWPCQFSSRIGELALRRRSGGSARRGRRSSSKSSIDTSSPVQPDRWIGVGEPDAVDAVADRARSAACRPGCWRRSSRSRPGAARSSSTRRCVGRGGHQVGGVRAAGEDAHHVGHVHALAELLLGGAEPGDR